MIDFWKLQMILRVFIISILFAGPALAQDDDWQLITAIDESFTIKMPGTPIRSTQDIPTEAGNIPMIMHILEKGSEIYMLAWFNSPIDISDSTQLQKSFNGARDRVISSQKGKLTYEGDITRLGVKGREIIFEIGTGTIAKMHLFFVKNRFFQLFAVGPKAGSMAASSEIFFNSFQFDESKIVVFDAAAPLVTRLFNEVGYTFQLDTSNNRYEVLLKFSDGRSQIVNVDHYNVGGSLAYDIIEVWAPVFRQEGALADSIAKNLLQENANNRYGSYELVEGQNFSLLVFTAEYPANVTAEVFKKLLLYVAEMADEMEKDLTGKDAY